MIAVEKISKTEPSAKMVQLHWTQIQYNYLHLYCIDIESELKKATVCHSFWVNVCTRRTMVRSLHAQPDNWIRRWKKGTKTRYWLRAKPSPPSLVSHTQMDSNWHMHLQRTRNLTVHLAAAACISSATKERHRKMACRTIECIRPSIVYTHEHEWHAHLHSVCVCVCVLLQIENNHSKLMVFIFFSLPLFGIPIPRTKYAFICA